MFFSGLSDNAIILNTSQFTKEYMENRKDHASTIGDDGKRLAFSLKDLAYVKEIEGVQEAILFDSTQSSMTDNNDNKLVYLLDKHELSNIVKGNASFASAPEHIRFSF